MSSEFAIKVENLSKCYHIYDNPRDRLLQMIMRGRKQYFREFWALRDISFEVKKGETVGIIGRNGSGKSTLLQMICGTLNPTGGSIESHGRIAALLELGSGFNPEFTGRENVYMNAAVLGLGKEEIEARFNDIAAFADIGEFIEQPIKTYSTGMVVRLAFAVSVCVEPEILIVDEALSVGDIAFQQKCLQRLADLRERGSTILLVTHDIMLTRNYCGRAIYLDHGIIKQVGDPELIGEAYLKDMFANQQKNGQDEVGWRHGQGSFGFGSKQGQITEVTLRGKNSSGIFRVGESITVSVAAQVVETINNPELIVQIRDERGYVLYGTRTSPENLHLTRMDDRVGVSAVMDFIAELGPGQYAITVGLNDRAGDTLVTLLDKVIAGVVFTIISDDKSFHGCINLHGHWRSPIAEQECK